MTSEVELVVPCYNEARRLDVEEFLRLSSAPGIRLLFVDDGSTDETRRVLEKIRALAPDRVSIHGLTKNAGKAEAVRSGLLAAISRGSPTVGFLDADLSTPVEEALRLAGLLGARPDVDVLLASRVRLLGSAVARNAVRHYLGRVFATAASMVLSLEIYDTQCGAKFFRSTPELRAALSEPFFSQWIFDVELLGRLFYGSLDVRGVPRERFLEVPLRSWRDVAGSKLKAHHKIRAAWDLARMRVQLRRRRKAMP